YRHFFGARSRRLACVFVDLFFDDHDPVLTGDYAVPRTRRGQVKTAIITAEAARGLAGVLLRMELELSLGNRCAVLPRQKAVDPHRLLFASAANYPEGKDEHTSWDAQTHGAISLNLVCLRNS